VATTTQFGAVRDRVFLKREMREREMSWVGVGSKNRKPKKTENQTELRPKKTEPKKIEPKLPNRTKPNLASSVSIFEVWKPNRIESNRKKKSYINTKKYMLPSGFKPFPFRLGLVVASQLDYRLYVVIIVPIIYL